MIDLSIVKCEGSMFQAILTGVENGVSFNIAKLEVDGITVERKDIDAFTILADELEFEKIQAHLHDIDAADNPAWAEGYISGLAGANLINDNEYESLMKEFTNYKPIT